MSLSTEFESVLPDIPQELLSQNSAERITLDMVREASKGKSQKVTDVYANFPRRVKEIIKLAGTQLSDTDMVNCNLLYRRGNFYHYRFELRWLTDNHEKIARISLGPGFFSNLQVQDEIGDEIDMNGIEIYSLDSRKRFVSVIQGFSDDPVRIEAVERARLLKEIGLKGKNHEPYQLELVRDLATIFRHP